MQCPSPKSPLYSAVILANRLALGSFFLLAGVAKVRGGITEFVNGPYNSLTPSWLPTAFSKPYGYALPIVELAAGAMLALGLVGRLASGVIALMLASFLIAVGVTDEHGPFSTNVILFTLAAMLTLTGAGTFSIDHAMCKSCRKG